MVGAFVEVAAEEYLIRVDWWPLSKVDRPHPSAGQAYLTSNGSPTPVSIASISLPHSHLAWVFSFTAGVVDEFNGGGVAAAQPSAEVHRFLWGRRQSFEEQVVVEGTQLRTDQRQSCCGLACCQRLEIKAQNTLIGQTQRQWEVVFVPFVFHEMMLWIIPWIFFAQWAGRGQRCQGIYTLRWGRWVRSVGFLR